MQQGLGRRFAPSLPIAASACRSCSAKSWLGPEGDRRPRPRIAERGTGHNLAMDESEAETKLAGASSPRAWVAVIGVAFALAMISLASNITTWAQLSGEANVAQVVRFTVSKLVNTGTLWAALGVWSGWLVRRPIAAATAGAVALISALVLHYGVGLALGRLGVLGMFDSSVWADNAYWFGLALVIGAPLGLIGAAARRADAWGALARLVVPAGAVVEPFLVGIFTQPSALPWPDLVSSVLCGAILVAAGIAGIAWAIRSNRVMGNSRSRATTYRAPGR